GLGAHRVLERAVGCVQFGDLRGLTGGDPLEIRAHGLRDALRHRCAPSLVSTGSGREYRRPDGGLTVTPLTGAVLDSSRHPGGGPDLVGRLPWGHRSPQAKETAMTLTATPAALVTGASGGLGAASAADLAADHAVLLGGRDAAALGALAEQVPGSRPWPVDLTDADAVAAACAGIDRLDVLVHNAGVCELGTIADSPTDQWR